MFLQIFYITASSLRHLRSQIYLPNCHETPFCVIYVLPSQRLLQSQQLIKHLEHSKGLPAELRCLE